MELFSKNVPIEGTTGVKNMKNLCFNHLMGDECQKKSDRYRESQKNLLTLAVPFANISM
jgi:hypothetical protein